MSDLHEQAKAVFLEAVALPPAQRGAFVAQAVRTTSRCVRRSSRCWRTMIRRRCCWTRRPIHDARRTSRRRPAWGWPRPR